MKKAPLTQDSDFIVGEEKAINYVMAALFLGLFGYGVTDAVGRPFKEIDYQSYVFGLAIFPAIICIKRAMKRRIYIRINKTGIYQDEQLVTGWTSFIKAYLSQKEKTGLFNIRDNFQLVVEYKKDGQGIRRKIPLTNTQNKSEEDVLHAVGFFWGLYKKGKTQAS